MHYFLHDLISVAAASALALPLLIMPGFGITALLARAGLIGEDRILRACWGVMLGPALLPAIDALLLRWVGMSAVFVLHLALAALGTRPARDIAGRVPPSWWVAVAAGWAAAAWANVDFDWHGRLYQSVVVIDAVKHAAVISALAARGVPLHDPFFARPGVAGYYYYFYIGPALLRWFSGFLIDSRAAFAAGTFAILLAFPATLVLIADAAALIPDRARRRFVNLLLLLCCLSGLDLLPGLWVWATTGHAYAQLDWWSEEVRWALTSILWVPHHIAAVVALFAGVLVLSGTQGRNPLLQSAIAGLAFATAFGCSVWIAIAAVPILALWWLYERLKTGMSSIWPLPLSAIAALLVSLPQIHDIGAGRASSGPPLTLYMRPLGPVRVLPHTTTEWLVHLAVTPGGYLIEFGIFALGAIIFLNRGRLASSRATSVGRLLLVSAPVALVLVTFVRSSVLYNDFGWRAVWFAQLPAMLWTASVLSQQPKQLTRSPMWSAVFALGLAATLWDITGMRLLRPYPLTFINQHPEVDYDLRATYQWIDRTLPDQVLVQHYPGSNRALDFGLYSNRTVPVADGEARLFGAAEEAVRTRMLLVAPLFERPMPMSEAHRRAAGAGAGGLLLTSDDPLWRMSGGPPIDWRCRYRSAHTCVLLVEKLH